MKREWMKGNPSFFMAIQLNWIEWSGHISCPLMPDFSHVRLKKSFLWEKWSRFRSEGDSPLEIKSPFHHYWAILTMTCQTDWMLCVRVAGLALSLRLLLKANSLFSLILFLFSFCCSNLAHSDSLLMYKLDI